MSTKINIANIAVESIVYFIKEFLLILNQSKIMKVWKCCFVGQR